ncbi:MAG TPA: FAD-dependent oxidoreductase [Polyangiaceae bacterium]|jgi:2-polyprenyl-6-methoxyphenol hydroxylase-like FAD-dependent oxidoreductase
MQTLETRCCIVGGGPAGVMLGHLLARAGVDVVVLEKHEDFRRDFRGDTVHPSTLDVLHELGLLEEFLALRHAELREIRARVGTRDVLLADFARTGARCQFMVFMPQSEFLSFLVERSRRYAGFHSMMQAEVTGLVEQAFVTGVRAQTPSGPLEVRADLVVACDGRHSTLRGRAGLEVEEVAPAIDVLWTRLSKRDGDPQQTLGYFDFGRLCITLDRGSHWECGMVARQGELASIRERGIGALRDELARVAPFASDRTSEIRSWSDVKQLDARIDRLVRWWRPGLLCIGDAAHAMSPIGGVGINLAIQDAVAAANVLAEPLKNRTLGNAHLEALQRRRMLPARLTQEVQAFIQNRVLARDGLRRAGADRMKPSPTLLMLERFPRLRSIPGRLIGIGLRPEHVA